MAPEVTMRAPATRRTLFPTALLVATALAASASAAPVAEAPSHRVALRAARLLDVRGGTVVADPVVLVEGDRIRAVGPRLPVPAGYEIVELPGLTLLPGLVDCHTHLAWQADNYLDDLFRKSPIDWAIMSGVYARRTLDAGFTTVRVLGAPELVDVALKKAIERGDVAGPRLQVATLPVGATGSHADLVGFSPYLELKEMSPLADGPDAIRKAVRSRVKYGADLIKMIASAGVLSEEGSVGAPQYSQEEMDALVAEARMWGRDVAAHAHGSEAIRRAVVAGVRSIEHGSMLDDPLIALMKERGTWLVADIYNDDFILAEFRKRGYPEALIAKERSVGRVQRESFRRAARAGVRIAFGTDAGIFPHGANGRQFAKMVEWGLTPLEAIRSATSAAAELLRWQDRIGALEAGLFADVIGVEGDPLSDVTLLERRIPFVMKGGVVYAGPRTGGVNP
jgi:imidazolonepropionase-like amidohydrolase